MSPFELIRDLFAPIGAIATALGLGWKVKTWRHDHSHHVEVKISNGFPTYGPGQPLGEWSFLVTAINRGDHPVTVNSIGLLHPNRADSTLVIMFPPFPGALPGVIHPRDSGMTWVGKEEVEARGLRTEGHAFVGFVVLSTGERVLSEPTVLVAAEKHERSTSGSAVSSRSTTSTTCMTRPSSLSWNRRSGWPDTKLRKPTRMGRALKWSCAGSRTGRRRSGVVGSITAFSA